MCYVIKSLYTQNGIGPLSSKDKSIEKVTILTEKLEEYSILLSILGIAANTAVSLIAEIGDIKGLDNNKQLYTCEGLIFDVSNRENPSLKTRLINEGKAPTKTAIPYYSKHD